VCDLPNVLGSLASFVVVGSGGVEVLPFCDRFFGCCNGRVFPFFPQVGSRLPLAFRDVAPKLPLLKCAHLPGLRKALNLREDARADAEHDSSPRVNISAGQLVRRARGPGARSRASCPANASASGDTAAARAARR
jgi:hypothetical protein